jgi:hypothetical protein
VLSGKIAADQIFSLSNHKITLLANQSEIEQQKAFDVFREIPVFPQCLFPNIVAQQIVWQGFEIEAVISPKQVQVCAFRDDYLSINHKLMVQWSRALREPSKPKMLVDLIQTFYIQIVSHISPQLLCISRVD